MIPIRIIYANVLHPYCNTFFCIFFFVFLVVLCSCSLFQLNATQLNSTHHVQTKQMYILCSYTIYVHIHIISNHYMRSIYVLCFMFFGIHFIYVLGGCLEEREYEGVSNNILFLSKLWSGLVWIPYIMLLQCWTRPC